MAIPAKLIANPVAVLREEFDDWAVLFNPDTADAVGINPVGVVIWKLMDGTRTYSDIAQVVSESFSDVPESVSDDVTDFIEKLSERGFIGAEA